MFEKARMSHKKAMKAISRPPARKLERDRTATANKVHALYDDIQRDGKNIARTIGLRDEVAGFGLQQFLAVGPMRRDPHHISLNPIRYATATRPIMSHTHTELHQPRTKLHLSRRDGPPSSAPLRNCSSPRIRTFLGRLPELAVSLVLLQ